MTEYEKTASQLIAWAEASTQDELKQLVLKAAELLKHAAPLEQLVAERQQALLCVADLKANLAALERDGKRLDWLDKNCSHVADSERYLQRHLYWGKGVNRTVRTAIDAAMEASK